MSRIPLLVFSLVAACGGAQKPSVAPAAVPVPVPVPVPAPVSESVSVSVSQPTPEPPPAEPPTDIFSTASGPLRIQPIFHGTVLFEHAGKVFIVDPWSQGNLADLPKADAIFITDVHPDHFDPPGIDAVRKDDTVIVSSPAVASQLRGVTSLKNGESTDVLGVHVEAVPMYNLVRGPTPTERFHEKGRGNGYVFTFGGARVYVSGDTECTPEMKALKNIDVAFISMNLPYTMPPSEAVECVRAFKPRVLYPYHFRGQDPTIVGPAVAPATEVRLRGWY